MIYEKGGNIIEKPISVIKRWKQFALKPGEILNIHSIRKEALPYFVG